MSAPNVRICAHHERRRELLSAAPNGGYLRSSFRNSATLRHPPPISGLVPVTRGSP